MITTLLRIANWIDAAHDRWHAQVARRRPLSAQIASLEEKVHRLEVVNDLLRRRLLRMPARHRPHYGAPERLQILWHRARYRLSVHATARAFAVTAQTIRNWIRDAESKEPHLAQARPPLRRLPDLVSDLAHRLKAEWPRWGTRRIAGVLARMGVRTSRSSVQRILRRRPPRRRVRPAPILGLSGRRLLAKRPNHIWLLDFTKVGGLLRSVHVGAVIDAFSRKVLAIAVYPGEPPAVFAARLLREAVASAGRSVWVVTDQGSQFTSRAFTRALGRLGIRRRFGAVGRKGSIALIERFWRTLKEEYARGLVFYLPVRSIERSLQWYAAWFNAERPHAGLMLRTPNDVHADRRPRKKGDLTHGVLRVRFLDGDANLPVLRLRRAA